MTAPTLPRERIENLIAWSELESGDGANARATCNASALRELLALRDERAKLREYVDLLHKHAMGFFGGADFMARGQSLRAAIGRREDGTWEER